MKRKLIFHAHFYQPPRMNPWSGLIEDQKSSSPAGNWNERIYHECYLPNTAAVIKNPEGQEETVNNFEYMSFDIGPTLSNWMAEKYIATYSSILAADWKNNNAMTLPYNHTILPLDTPQRRHAQIAWGIEEFTVRFKRKPEGMWLPECAVNYDTAEDLVRAGIKYIVLTPGQAVSFKRLYGKQQYYISDTRLDIRRPYRLKTWAGYLDVFFANEELGVDISFRKALDDPVKFADNIEKAFGSKHSEDLVITIVTDGETFGHHQKGTEKGLAYLLKYELPRRGIEVTNFSEYLNEHPPGWAVRLKDDSSWSCSHGIERWRSACGCGAEEGSDLDWRKPLREALSVLSDDIMALYIEKTEGLFKIGPVEALNDYGEVLTDCSRAHEFRKRHLREECYVDNDLLMIMEMLYSSFYMFTSCGWFFGSLSRLEPIQNLSFALRAIQIARELWDVDFEMEFVEKLKEYEGAFYIWNGVVKNRYMSPEQLAREYVKVYIYTGASRDKWGDWYITASRDGALIKIALEHIRTGQTFHYEE